LLVAFDWNSVVAPPPAVDEFEISFFGPGHGECIVMHVGSGRWVVVDSCVDTTDKANPHPVAEKYLTALGVDMGSTVDLIVASHWHADHIRGLGRLVERCSSALFSCAQAMVKEEFIVFAEEMASASASTNGAKLEDFREAIRHLHDRGKPIRWAQGNKLLKAWNPNDAPSGVPRCSVTALSPSDLEYTSFIAEIAVARPTPARPKRAAAATSPNLVSIVLHVQFGDMSVLLGADMEVHHDPRRGWTAAVAAGHEAGLAPAQLIKIPHHGSVTGHHDELWTRLVSPNPLAVVTPFNKLPDERKLPTAADVARLKGLTSRLYQTAPAIRPSSRGREATVDRGLRDSNIVLRDAAQSLGMVRCRWSPLTGWSEQVFPPAMLLTTPPLAAAAAPTT
jgi:beta-lactamase superfamily II metal-dependent hydrolase